MILKWEIAEKVQEPLDAERGVWSRIVKGPIDGDVVFSPSGDMLAYGQNGTATIVRVGSGAGASTGR